MRRIHDAGFATPLAAIPVIVFWVNLYALGFIDNGLKWLIFSLGGITTLAFTTISNAKIRHSNEYHFGYHGPIDLSTIQNHKDSLYRVEPTIAGSEVLPPNDDLFAADKMPENKKIIEQTRFESGATHFTWELKLGKLIQSHPKQSLGIVISTFLSISIVIFLLSGSEPKTENGEETSSEQTAMPSVNDQRDRLNKLAFDDNFWIMHDENDAITIAWEGDTHPDGFYWSAKTGKGDKTCVDLHFSLGEDLRSLDVIVKNNGDYYANFSPVDTKSIVKSIADKDRFKLCGYEFVLKGTRVKLRKNAKYRSYLD